MRTNKCDACLVVDVLTLYECNYHEIMLWINVFTNFGEGPRPREQTLRSLTQSWTNWKPCVTLTVGYVDFEMVAFGLILLWCFWAQSKRVFFSRPFKQRPTNSSQPLCLWRKTRRSHGVKFESREVGGSQQLWGAGRGSSTIILAGFVCLRLGWEMLCLTLVFSYMSLCLVLPYVS